MPQKMLRGVSVVIEFNSHPVKEQQNLTRLQGVPRIWEGLHPLDTRE